ncbi:lipocalin family protein [Salinisphaera sp. Q1T1-3]|uniref:lipocalin family protein n=1 Tax=Salinisphaera sp. Q1T1-3 TaxID=2321229 RepID=UPI000E7181BF|nr:lipocalin family protein [Salinisphaera sp. Q1T1-3]RJS91205.1 hypothetical protein D3260_16245 [Salinisphaera sp. Q1T1-3]
MRKTRLSVMVGAVMALAGCSLMPPKTFPTADHVDLDRFMGPWYVIAHIPPSKTKNAYNEIERYTRGDDSDTINVKFTYRDGGFDGEQKTMTPWASVLENSENAVWAMHFYYVLRLQYVISYVSPDYDTTIVARDKRDYVWIMARTPKISDAKYQSLVERVGDMGYDTSKLRKVPQQPLSERDDL